MLINLLLDTFKRITDVKLPAVNQMAAEYGKRPRKSVTKMSARVKELKAEVRQINGKDRAYKRKREELEAQVFTWPSDSTTPGPSQPSQPSQGDKYI